MVRMRRPLISVTSCAGKHCLLSVAAKCIASESRSQAHRKKTHSWKRHQAAGRWGHFLSFDEEYGTLGCFHLLLLLLFWFHMRTFKEINVACLFPNGSDFAATNLRSGERVSVGARGGFSDRLPNPLCNHKLIKQIMYNINKTKAH